MAAVNIANTEIYFVARNIKESSKDQTEVYLLKEISVDEQIKRLIFANRIAEARELVNSRGNKMPEKFDLKRKKFNLDVAWQLLKNTTDFNQIVSSFAQTDVDPRELILLFQNLVQTASINFRQMFKIMPTNFLFNFLQQQQLDSFTQFNLEKTHQEGKTAIRGLLEKLNAKYVSDLRMDPLKEADFMTSEYSPMDEVIKRDEKPKMKEIV